MLTKGKKWAFAAGGAACVAIIVAGLALLRCGGHNTPQGASADLDYGRIPRVTPGEFPRKSALKLSDIVEDLQVVHLDSDNPDAMLGTYVAPTLSENYIGIKSSEPNLPFRLYDRTSGRFVRKIGNVGRGPGEYLGLSDWVIDEANDRVYLVPFGGSSILEYTLAGKFVGEVAVPGINGGRKTKIEVRDTIFTAHIMPFKGDSLSVFTFTKSGRLLAAAPSPVEGEANFDNEVYVNKTGAAQSGYMISSVPVYYGYDRTTGTLDALFVIDRTADPKHKWYGEVHESPSRYLIKVFHVAFENGDKRPKDYWLSLDKQTDERAAGDLINDFLGGIETTNSSWPNKYYDDHYFVFENGWYMETIPAVIMKRLLKEALAGGKMSPEVRTRVDTLYSSFEEDDNHFLFYGKLK